MAVAKHSTTRPQARSSFFMRRSVLGFFAALAAFGMFAAVVLVAYEENISSGDVIVPIVRAEKGPMKIRPETPGGMTVPFQDKLVYDRLSKTAEGAEKTHLLPPPETPVALPKAPAAALKGPAAAPKAPAKIADSVTAGEVPPKTEVLRRLEMETPPVKAAPALAKAKALAKPKPANAVSEQTLRIQIASLRSEQAVRDQWARLQKAHGDLFGPLALHVQRADLGGRGIFFRLQAGPLAGVAAAKALCATLQQRKLGCLLVRP